MKPDPTLLYWPFIHQLAERMTAGQKDHPPGRNWLNLTEEELLQGLQRHVIDYSSGIKVDAKTNQSNLIAIGCRAMMLFERQCIPGCPKIMEYAPRCLMSWRGASCILAPHQHGYPFPRHCYRMQDGQMVFLENPFLR